MTWATFGILGDEIRNKEDIFLGESNTYLIALKQTQAKSEMVNDLIDIYKFESSTDGDLDTLLGEETNILREMLSCKQLALYYFDNDMGEGSINRNKSRRYAQLYEQYTKRLRLRYDTNSTYGSGHITR